MIYGNMRDHEYVLRGCKTEIMVEITSVLHRAYEKEIFTKEDILQIADLATKSEEKLKADCDEKMKNDPLLKALDKIIDDAGNGNKAAADLLNILLDAMLKKVM